MSFQNDCCINNNISATEHCWYTFRSRWLVVCSFCLLQAIAPLATVLRIIRQHTVDHIKHTWDPASWLVPLLDDSNSAFYNWQEKFTSVRSKVFKQEHKQLPYFLWLLLRWRVVRECLGLRLKLLTTAIIVTIRPTSLFRYAFYLYTWADPI